MSKPVETALDAPILLTMGEPAGIGPEIAVAAYRALGGHVGARPLRIVGDTSLFADIPDILATAASVTRTLGKPNPKNNGAVTQAIEIAVRACLAGEAAAVVTAPINKDVLRRSGFAFPGHTEFLGALTGTTHPVMMLASARLRVVPLTIHMPLADVPRAITTDSIVATAEIVLAALARDFRIATPRLAIAGLNPHPGEFGDEDMRIVAPAVEQLKAKGRNVRGPLPADTLFHEEARKTYDAALCMYHDQALIPIKTLSFWDGVNVTLGLPIVRTSPDHGTAFDIAGTGKADPRSMIAAIRMAADIADARRA